MRHHGNKSTLCEQLSFPDNLKFTGKAEINREAFYCVFTNLNIMQLKVVSKVKAIVKGVSTYFKCTYASEGGRITIDFNRRDGKIADAERLDGKYALVSTRITMSAKEIISAYNGAPPR